MTDSLWRKRQEPEYRAVKTYHEGKPVYVTQYDKDDLFENQQQEEDDDDDYDEDLECSWCHGCGEGDYDGAVCQRCHGTGIEPGDTDDYDYI